MKNGIKLILCIAIPLLVGGLSGFLTSDGISTWYVTLNKPSFNPPNYLFGPVWTVLYLLMGVSLYLIVKQPKVERSNIVIFVIQLVLNFFWSFLFFKYQQLGLALIEIVLLWGSILTMIVLFYKSNKWAGLINIPYLLWVSFATLLNYSLYILN